MYSIIFNSNDSMIHCFRRYVNRSYNPIILEDKYSHFLEMEMTSKNIWEEDTLPFIMSCIVKAVSHNNPNSEYDIRVIDNADGIVVFSMSNEE